MAGAILFVDDEPDLLYMAASYFELCGHTILTAANAAEALRRAQNAPLQAVILDVSLPGGGSAQLLAALKQSHPQTPVILYTGCDEHDETVQFLLRQGACKYLMKDGSLAKVLQVVQSVG